MPNARYYAPEQRVKPVRFLGRLGGAQHLVVMVSTHTNGHQHLGALGAIYAGSATELRTIRCTRPSWNSVNAKFAELTSALEEG
jgi:hypothetical protein